MRQEEQIIRLGKKDTFNWKC